MTTINSFTHVKPHVELTPKVALRISQVSWAIFLAVPFMLLQFMIWYIMNFDSGRLHDDSQLWFPGSMGYLIAIVPAACAWRGWQMRDWRADHPVSPRKYLVATIPVLAVLAAGGALSLVACILTNSFMPNLIPGLLALILFTLHLPSGSSMISPASRTLCPASPTGTHHPGCGCAIHHSGAD